MRAVDDSGVYTLYANSNEPKPTREQILKWYENQPVVFYEMDTGKVYMYDYKTDQWYLQ